MDSDKIRRQFRNALRHVFLIRRRHYVRLLMPDDVPSRDAEIVLADLREFCFARTTSFSQDPYVAARNAGRRDVWLRISQHLNLDESEVWKMMEVDSDL